MKTHRQTGMTLIELMVALAIGAFLMIGAITVFMQSRTTFRLTESIARIQENARLALEVLEPEIRMAHYWGLTTTTTSVLNRTAPASGNRWGKDACNASDARVLDVAVGGSNNAYGFSCLPTVGAGQATSDTLVVRRAAEDPEVGALTGAATVRIQSGRNPLDAQIFVGTTVPAGYSAATSQTHRVLMNGYYVSNASSLGAVPSLRVKTLLADGSIQDQEVVAGVEDMQIQLGIDTDLPDANDRGSIDRYVNVDDPIIDPSNAGFNPDAVVLAVRLWLRIRGERDERGFADPATYAYADQNFDPAAGDDAFRRIVVSKTIYLRNARPIPP